MQTKLTQRSPQGAPESIGIFGGTFDPIHFGHLKSAKEIKQALKLSELRLIPCGNPAHRQMPKANAEQRLAMLRLALPDFSELIVDDSELLSSQASYTFNTISKIHDEQPQARLFLIIGTDAFQEFTTWYQWRKILQLCHLVLLERPGYKLDSASPEMALLEKHRVQSLQQMQLQPSGTILTIKLIQHDVSATDIRQRVAAGQPIQGLVPERVVNWIYKNKLYR